MELTTGYEGRKARIEIVPLIDVVFLLLVFFIYAMLSMSVYRGIRVDLPYGDGTQEDVKTVVITIGADNTLSLNGEFVVMSEAITLAAQQAEERQGPVLVRGDRNADLGVAVELLAGLRDLAVAAVSFQVQETGGALQPGPGGDG